MARWRLRKSCRTKWRKYSARLRLRTINYRPWEHDRVADWDERYRKGEHAPTIPHQLLTQAVDLLLPGRALDLACGAGRHAVYLASRGWLVTAVDSSPVGLEIARQRASEAKVKIDTVEADLEQHEFRIEP